MSHEEALDVLGLSPGASAQDIRDAYRRYGAAGSRDNVSH